MKSLFFLFLLIIMFTSLNFVDASGVSPGVLEYNLQINEKECGIIKIDSTSEIISVSDKWAENENTEWRINLFEEDASSHSISIDYESELSLDERELEVCLSGDDLGVYKGAVILREEKQGNSIIQYIVWLKVTISNNPGEESVQTTQTGSNLGSSGNPSGGDGGSNPTQSQITTENISIDDLSDEEDNEIHLGELEGESEEQTKENSNEFSSGITGSVIGSSLKNNWKKLFGFSLIAIFAIAIFAYNKRRKN